MFKYQANANAPTPPFRYASSPPPSATSSDNSVQSASSGASTPTLSIELSSLTHQLVHGVRAKLCDSPLLPLPPNFYNTWKEFNDAGEAFKNIISEENNKVKEEVRKFTVRCAFTGLDACQEFAGPDRVKIDKLNETLTDMEEQIVEALKIKYIDTKGWLPPKTRNLNSELLKKIHAI